jgi:membrane protease YdiL (CAAX protease family)
VLSPSAPTRRGRITQPHYVWLYVLLLSALELFWGLSYPFLAISFHATFLFFLLFRAQFLTGALQDFYIALAAVPAVQIVSLSLPVWPMWPLAQRVAVALPLALIAVMTARALHYNLFRRQLLNSLVYMPLQLVLGMIVGILVYVLLHPSALIPATSLNGAASGLVSSIVWSVLGLVVIAFSEEILFRGLLLGASTRLLGPVQGIILAALAYTSLLLGQGPWLLIVLLLVFGLGCGWLAYATRSVFGVGVLHSAALVTLFLILPTFAQRSGG